MLKIDFFKKLVDIKEQEIAKSLEETKNNYRPYDPGNYLYRILLKNYADNKSFSEENIELIYVTLSAWNMNSRGAKLSDFIDFKKSLLLHKKEIETLKNVKLGEMNEEDALQIYPKIKQLFHELNLVQRGKPKLVTFSKTMHFLLPNLIMPIDRTYTLNFFFGHTNLNKDEEKQLQILWEIVKATNNYAKNNKYLLKFEDKTWNVNIPKIIDNIIIGYVRINH